MVPPEKSMPTLSRRRFLQSAAMGLATAALAPAAFALASEGPLPTAYRGDLLVYLGSLIGAEGEMIHIDVLGSSLVAGISPAVPIWRGGGVPLSRLQEGDDMMVHVRGNRVVRAWANLSRVRGVVVDVSDGVYTVRGYDASKFGLEVTGGTDFLGTVPGRVSGPDTLAPGTAVDAIGMMDRGVLQATTLSYLHASADNSGSTDEPASSVDRIVVDTAAGPLSLCNTTYYGYATWYYCTASKAKCGTYSYQGSGYGGQGACAWPKVTTYALCDVTTGCKNQSAASCGLDIFVSDRCSSSSLPCAVVDRGPCDNNNCSPNLCNGASGNYCYDCLESYTPIVDLTHDTFSLFYDPSKRGCFSCKCVNTITC